MTRHIFRDMEVDPENPESSKKKKRPQKSGGSFCAMSGCTNRSSRDSSSKIKERSFLRYFLIPRDVTMRKKWVARIGRDHFNPSNYTRICSDHFHDSDMDTSFLESGGKKVKLRPGAIPNTDRSTGAKLDPLQTQQKRRKISRTLPEQDPCGSGLIPPQEQEVPSVRNVYFEDDEYIDVVAVGENS